MKRKKSFVRMYVSVRGRVCEHTWDGVSGPSSAVSSVTYPQSRLSHCVYFSPVIGYTSTLMPFAVRSFATRSLLYYCGAHPASK